MVAPFLLLRFGLERVTGFEPVIATEIVLSSGLAPLHPRNQKRSGHIVAKLGRCGKSSNGLTKNLMIAGIVTSREF